MELLKVKSVDRITIRDLTERVEINRCTFYHHYQDIYDLLEQIEDGVMEHVLEMMRGFHPNREEDVSRRYFECFCQYIYENRVSILRADQWPGEPVHQKTPEDDIGIHGGIIREGE